MRFDVEAAVKTRKPLLAVIARLVPARTANAAWRFASWSCRIEFQSDALSRSATFPGATVCVLRAVFARAGAQPSTLNTASTTLTTTLRPKVVTHTSFLFRTPVDNPTPAAKRN
jgi:hypothetical protein